MYCIPLKNTQIIQYVYALKFLILKHYLYRTRIYLTRIIHDCMELHISDVAFLKCYFTNLNKFANPNNLCFNWTVHISEDVLWLKE